MITRKYGFKFTYDATGWQTTRTAAYLPGSESMTATPPAGALERPGAMPKLNMRRPRLMMDPSDPSTWQREYRFTR